ncbi:MAG TPA: hypothetical protein VF933_16475 [Streptosporangiaceae bacterium]
MSRIVCPCTAAARTFTRLPRIALTCRADASFTLVADVTWLAPWLPRKDRHLRGGRGKSQGFA